MKQKKVWRYYCDHCRKSGCNAGHIKTHEKHCTGNPQRECRLCDTKQRDYIGLAKKLDETADLEATRAAVDNCPVCILSVIKQCQKLKGKDATHEGGWWQEFDFKVELQEWWTERNNEAAEADLRAMY